MFCEVADTFGYVALWAAMSVSGLVAMLLLSSLLFYPFYVNVRYVQPISYLTYACLYYLMLHRSLFAAMSVGS